MDREKVIKGLEACRKTDCINCPYSASETEVCLINYLLTDALALLKEQEAEIDEISDEYLDLGKEMAKQPEIVRCKDCKYGYHLVDTKKGEIIKYRIACLKRSELIQNQDWFCADGERRI